MADETVTEPVNTAAPEEQATTPAPEASAATPAPTPSPASMPKPHAPSPAAFAKKTPAAKPRAAAPAAATAAYSEADVKAAEAFGRVDDNGTVFVKDGDAEREVGQFPDVSKEEALALYARRFLDLKAKLDLLATRLASPNIKAREIDESVKLLGEETSEPAVVGDLAALKTQYEELKAAGEAKKTEIAEARKAAQAKAVAERTAIVEKAEALAASLGDNTNWRSTADKFRNLFDEWQNHQRTTVRIDKPEAEALWKRFSVARTTFNQARRKWAQARDNERTAAKEAKEAIIAEANELKDSTAWGETSRKFNDLMDRWKKAGRAGRNEDDELWAKFREAADTFFNARQADRDQINSSEKENLAAKEALLVKAEALVPVKTDAEAKKAIVAHIGPSNVWCGEQAAEFVNKNFPDGANGFILEGPAGLSVVKDRGTGWGNKVASNVKVLESQSANWSTDEAKTVTAGLLDKYKSDNPQFIFAQNDEMGLGAAQAVDAAGLKGKVKIITIDGTKNALQALVDGDLSYVIEYNPIFGKETAQAVKDYLDGKTVEKDIEIESKTFDAASAKEALDNNTRAY